MKKVLFMVPHEDDELLVGGPLLLSLIRDEEIDVYVFIALNGDHDSTSHVVRVQETINVLNLMGLEKNHIIFGGYGDCWKGKHIYNSKNDEIKESHGGFKATYLDVLEMEEWHYQRYHEHIPYTRRGYLNDIKDLINVLLPDVIVCVDMDSHEDHRCLSLLVEEAISYILKSDLKYEPALLKKFAYQGVMFGRYDFFSYPHKRAWNDSNSTSNPYYKWDDRISYMVPEDCRTLFLANNYLYKLAVMYRSQDMWTWAPRFINEDIVFWTRNTNNILLKAEVRVSSGQKHYLNDFKLIDTTDVNNEECDYTELCWRPDNNDSERNVVFTLNEGKTVRYIRLFFNAPGGLHGNYYLQYEGTDGYKEVLIRDIDCDEGFFIDEIMINPTEVVTMKFNFSNVIGNLGIGEIEAFAECQQIPFAEYLYVEKHSNNECYILKNFLLFLEKMIFVPRAEIYSIFRRLKRSVKKRKNFILRYLRCIY